MLLTDALRSDDATEPLTRWLVDAAREWSTIACDRAAFRLGKTWRFGQVHPERMGIVACAAMDKILRVDSSAPVLISLLVRRDSERPGSEIDPYLRRRFGDRCFDEARSGEPCSDPRSRVVEAAIEEVYACEFWNELYLRVYGDGDKEKTDPCRGRRAVRPLVPNDETVSAIEAARRGELIAVGSVEELIANLNAED